MSYAPSNGDAVSLALDGDYTPPDGQHVALHIARPCYFRPSGEAVELALGGDYTPPPGDQVSLYLVCDGTVPLPPDPDPDPEAGAGRLGGGVGLHGGNQALGHVGDLGSHT